MLISDDDELSLGHPLLRPESEVCFVSRSAEMDAEKVRLRFALLAAAPDGRRDFSIEAMHHAVSELPDARDANLVVRRFAPESFLVIFSSQRTRDVALRAGSVPVGSDRLYF